ncbi:MAG: DUF1080 domain-containing protein [Chthoniobacteraceae bacterium]
MKLHFIRQLTASRWWPSSLAAVVFSLLPLALSAADDRFIGRWALTLPNGGAGWLGVEQKGDSLAASLLWGGGSVLPVKEVSVAGDTLKVHIASGKTIREITATRAGDDLKLTTANLKPDGTPGDSQPFSGRRIADVPPAPDLTKVTFGAPIKLLAGELDATWQLVEKDALNGWSLSDGVLANRLPEGKHPRLGNLRTRAVFDDFRLTTEVRTQASSNSGIYLRGIYEIQIADSFGKPVDPHNMGALYSRITPSVAAEKAVGEWQTLAITLMDRHVTVVLNGQTIIDNQPVLGCTGGALTSDETQPGPIMLQGDHTTIDYRNMELSPVVKK